MKEAPLSAPWLDRRRERPTMAGLLLISAISLASPAPAKALSLNEALAAAYDNNPQLAAARAQRKVDEGVPQALALRRPTVTGQAGVGATNGAATASGGSNGTQTETRVGPVGAVAFNVPLWTAGRADAAIAGADARIEAGLEALRATEQDVLLRAATAYADVLRTQNVMDVNRKHEQELDAELAGVKRRFGAGELRATDVSATEAQAALGRARVTQAEGNLDRRPIFVARLGWNRITCNRPICPRGCLPGARNRWTPQPTARRSLRRPTPSMRPVPPSPRHGRSSGPASPPPVASATRSRRANSCSASRCLMEVSLKSQSRGAKQELEQRRLELDGQRITARQDAVTAWDSLQDGALASRPTRRRYRLPRGHAMDWRVRRRKDFGHSSTSWPPSSTCSTPNLRSRAPVETSWSAPTDCLPLPGT